MLEISGVALSLDAFLPGAKQDQIKEAAAVLGVLPAHITKFSIARKSVDARKKKNVHFTTTVQVQLPAEQEARLLAHAPKGCVVREYVPYVPLEYPHITAYSTVPPAAAATDVPPTTHPAEAAALSTTHSAAAVASPTTPPAAAVASPTTPPAAAAASPTTPPAVPPMAPLVAPSMTPPIVVGAGPAGLFAALYLARCGLRPVLIEQGQPVQERAKSVEAFNATGTLNAYSNIQFGEGGAGTFSDGKLTTNIKNPYTRHVLHTFVQAGAPESILQEAHPHLGSDNLPRIVRTLREEIIARGGEVLFNTKLVNWEFETSVPIGERGTSAPAEERAASAPAGERAASMSVGECRPTTPAGERAASAPIGEFNSSAPADGCAANVKFPGVPTGKRAAAALVDGHEAGVPACELKPTTLAGAKLASIELENVETGVREVRPARQLILACGHSARDVFELCYKTGFAMEQKPFSLGVRIEHEQAAINKAQWGTFANHAALGAAEYKLAVHLPSGASVYTFCMCPGGEVVAAASEADGIVTNGMSSYARAGTNANAALLVGVSPSQFGSSYVLAGVELQRSIERAAFELSRRCGGAAYQAPAQRVGAFLRDCAIIHAAGTSAALDAPVAAGTSAVAGTSAAAATRNVAVGSSSMAALGGAAGARASSVAASNGTAGTRDMALDDAGNAGTLVVGASDDAGNAGGASRGAGDAPVAGVDGVDKASTIGARAAAFSVYSAKSPVQPTYARGVVEAPLVDCLPDFVSQALAEALPLLGRKLKGFDNPDALLTAPETRSSSPVRICRNKETLQAYFAGEGAGVGVVSAGAVDMASGGVADMASGGVVDMASGGVAGADVAPAAAAPDAPPVAAAVTSLAVPPAAAAPDVPPVAPNVISATGIYPCGEGPGFAGGIMSAACDGLRVAEKLAQTLCGS